MCVSLPLGTFCVSLIKEGPKSKGSAYKYSNACCAIVGPGQHPVSTRGLHLASLIGLVLTARMVSVPFVLAVRRGRCVGKNTVLKAARRHGVYRAAKRWALPNG